MKKLTAKQAYVLENINRVVPLAPKINSRSPPPRYQLDDKECTSQIFSLSIAKLISKHSNGGFRRLAKVKQPDKASGERQAPLPQAIDAIRNSLSLPPSARAIGPGKSGSDRSSA